MTRHQPPLRLTERGEWVSDLIAGVFALILIPLSIVPVALWLGTL